MTNDQKEVIELAKKCGADIYDVVRPTLGGALIETRLIKFNESELIALAAALKEQMISEGCPDPNEEGAFICERYDHDAGGWVADSVEDVGMRVIDDSREDYECGTVDALRAELQRRLDRAHTLIDAEKTTNAELQKDLGLRVIAHEQCAERLTNCENAFEELQRQLKDHEEVHADHRRLVREFDVILNGEEGAAKQASLCDIVAQMREAAKQDEDEFKPKFVKFRDDQCGCKYAEYELQLTSCGGEFEGDAPKLYALPPNLPALIEQAKEKVRSEYCDVVPRSRMNALDAEMLELKEKLRKYYEGAQILIEQAKREERDIMLNFCRQEADNCRKRVQYEFEQLSNYERNGLSAKASAYDDMAYAIKKRNTGTEEGNTNSPR